MPYKRIICFISTFLYFSSALVSAEKSESEGQSYYYKNCGVKYEAQLQERTLKVSASGKHPIAGYQTWLSVNTAVTMPPEFFLHERKPAGPSAQVETDFYTAQLITLTDEAVDKVIFYDSCGRHEVKINRSHGK